MPGVAGEERVQVDLGDRDDKGGPKEHAIKPENLVRVCTAAAPARPAVDRLAPPGSTFAVGEDVEVRGLIKAAHLNGRVGRVKSVPGRGTYMKIKCKIK